MALPLLALLPLAEKLLEKVTEQQQQTQQQAFQLALTGLDALKNKNDPQPSSMDDFAKQLEQSQLS